MSTSKARVFDATCGNCDRPARALQPLVRFSIRGHRLDLTVCRFCYLQLAPHRGPRPHERQLRPWLRAP